MDLTEDMKADIAVQCARFSAVLAFPIGCSLFFLRVWKQYFAPCVHPAIERLILGLEAGIQICMGLIYSLLRSNGCVVSGCTWDNGAIFNVTAQGVYFGALIGARYMTAPCFERPRPNVTRVGGNPA
jgi:hypothetical protein